MHFKLMNLEQVSRTNLLEIVVSQHIKIQEQVALMDNTNAMNKQLLIENKRMKTGIDDLNTRIEVLKKDLAKSEAEREKVISISKLCRKDQLMAEQENKKLLREIDFYKERVAGLFQDKEELEKRLKGEAQNE